MQQDAISVMLCFSFQKDVLKTVKRMNSRTVYGSDQELTFLSLWGTRHEGGIQSCWNRVEMSQITLFHKHRR